MSSKNFCSNLFIWCVRKNGYIKAKSIFWMKLSSQIFYATRSEHKTNGRQFVGYSGISVKEMSRLM